MFRTIRPLVASALCTVSMFALSTTALAMPAGPDPATPFGVYAPSTATHHASTVTDHGSSVSLAVWIILGVAVIAVTAALVTFTASRRNPSPRVAGS